MSKSLSLAGKTQYNNMKEWIHHNQTSDADSNIPILEKELLKWVKKRDAELQLNPPSIVVEPKVDQKPRIRKKLHSQDYLIRQWYAKSAVSHLQVVSKKEVTPELDCDFEEEYLEE